MNSALGNHGLNLVKRIIAKEKEKMNTFETTSRYDRSSKKETKQYRFLTMDELKEIGSHAQVIDRNGQIANVKVTSLKTWKTRSDVLVGWKFGLYEYGKELVTEYSPNEFFVTEVSKE